jgi:hypothetical protein
MDGVFMLHPSPVREKDWLSRAGLSSKGYRPHVGQNFFPQIGREFAKIVGTAGMVSHDFHQFVLGFGADHEIAIGPRIPAADLSVNFPSHV